MLDNIESTMEEIRLEDKGDGIAVLTINRPQKRNAITGAMAAEMTRLLRAMDLDSEVRVIILTGVDYFSSGGDMAAATMAGTAEKGRAHMRNYTQLIKTLTQIDIPAIAAVESYAIGAGMSVALACDVIYAAEDAYFMSNFNHLGVPPECGALVFLPLTVGPYRAKELWYTARKVTAAEAEEKYGFVSKVCDKSAVLDDSIELAKTISGLPTVGVRLTKHYTNNIAFSELDIVLDSETQNTPLAVTSEESKKLFMSFLAKKTKRASEEK